MVYTEGDRSVALVVDRIVDIVEDAVSVRRDLSDDGMLATAVVEQQVTELLDVRDIRAGVERLPDHHAGLGPCVPADRRARSPRNPRRGPLLLPADAGDAGGPLVRGGLR